MRKKKRKMKRKILFTPYRGLGDFIHSLPLIYSLKESFLNYEITIPIVDNEQRKTSFSLKPLIENLVKFDYKRLREDLDSQRKLLYRGKDFRDKFKIQFEERRNFEKNVYEFYLKDEHYDLAIIPRFFNIDTIKCEKQFNLYDLGEVHNLHMVDRNLKFADILKIPKKINFDLKIPSTIKDNKGRKISLPRDYVVFVLSAGRVTKKWTIEGYKTITKFCIQRGYCPVVVGSENDFEDSIKIEEAGAVNLISEREVLIDLGNFARIAKGSRAVIGSDTGLVHIADAIGSKVIGLYGPTRPSKFAPYNNKEKVVSTNHTTKRMVDIKPEEVISKLEKILT